MPLPLPLKTLPLQRTSSFCIFPITYLLLPSITTYHPVLPASMLSQLSLLPAVSSCCLSSYQIPLSGRLSILSASFAPALITLAFNVQHIGEVADFTDNHSHKELTVTIQIIFIQRTYPAILPICLLYVRYFLLLKFIC